MSRSQSERMIQPIASINPYSSKWTICCRISAKANIRNWSNSKGEGKLLSFEASDASGIIRCTAFNEIAVRTDSLIELDKVVYINNAELRPANKKFAGNSTHDYEMMINDGTLIEPCIDTNTTVPAIKYDFKTIDQIQTIPKDSIVDFLGVCREVGEVIEITAKSTGNQMKKREIKLVDMTKLEVNCTMWGKEAEDFICVQNSILLIKNAKISEFNGRSLNASNITGIIINPNIKECHDMKNWFEKEGQHLTIESISKSKNTFSGNQVITSIAVAKNSPVSDVDKGDYYTFRAMISLIKKDRDIFYKACPTKECFKKVLEDEAMGNYRCEKCNKDFSNFKYRYMLSLEAQDHSGSIWITCFQDAAQTVLGYTSDDLGQEQDTMGKEVVEKLIESKLFQTFYFRVRIKRETYQDESKLKVVALGVISTVDTSFENDCKQLFSMIRNLKST